MAFTGGDPACRLGSDIRGARRAVAQFAAGLAGLGVGPGDAVATLMGKSAELVIAAARGSGTAVLFTCRCSPRSRLRPSPSGWPGAALWWSWPTRIGRAELGPGSDIRRPWRIVSGGGYASLGDVPLAEMMANGDAGPQAPPEAVGAAAPLVLVRIGTAGAPKGVPVALLRALAGICCYMDYGLELPPKMPTGTRPTRPGMGLRPVLRNPRAIGHRDTQHPAARRVLAVDFQVLQRFGVTNSRPRRPSTARYVPATISPWVTSCGRLPRPGSH